MWRARLSQRLFVTPGMYGDGWAVSEQHQSARFVSGRDVVTKNYFLLSHDRGGSRAARNRWSFSRRLDRVILATLRVRVSGFGLPTWAFVSQA